MRFAHYKLTIYGHFSDNGRWEKPRDAVTVVEDVDCLRSLISCYENASFCTFWDNDIEASSQRPGLFAKN